MPYLSEKNDRIRQDQSCFISIVGRTLNEDKSDSPKIRINSYNAKTWTTENGGMQGKSGIYKVPDDEKYRLPKHKRAVPHRTAVFEKIKSVL